ncbi:MAG: hypothetical protein D6808_06565 [Candidatus Dadabacteria bacterium]|nr:MAG: hypothetical protein D6808_06565 [Candidatus Dadabacteria bacterium]
MRKIPFLNTAQSVTRLFLNPHISVNEKFECIRFYFTAYGHKRLFATLPRSGYNYSIIMLNIAWDLAQGGTGEYYYNGSVLTSNVLLNTPLDWRTPLGKSAPTTPNSPVIFHTHLPYHHVVNYQKDRMKTAVLVRNLFNQLESFLYHEGYDESSQDKFVNSWQVDWVIDFCNSWGRFLETHRDAILLKYEELVKNPMDTLTKLSDFWELDLPEHCIQDAIKKCTKEEMLKRIPQEERKTNKQVSNRKRDIFSKKNINIIRKKFKKRLKYDFGYTYEL